MAGWKDAIAALLGISAYAAPPAGLPTLDDGNVEKIRKLQGGQISPLPQTKTRWYLADLEAAMHAADAGDLSRAAQLCRSMRRDGVLAGLLSTTSGGLVRLPRRFSGREDIVHRLEGREGVRNVFDDMFPPAELEMMAADGALLGVSVGELVPVEGRAFPVLVRLEPEWLRYRWNENRWYYLSIAGPIPITPGDGRWVLHVQGGRIAPWQNGLWHALGRAWINKEHALLHRANWEAKLANPARAAISPQAANDAQKAGFLSNLIQWGVNTVFELPSGWDVKIIESNGRGYQSFGQTIEWAEREYMIALAGQVMTTDGGEGFSNGDIGKSVRADLIKARADALAFTLNTQGIPPYVVQEFGIDALDETGCVEWDTTPPRDLAVEAQALLQAAQGIQQMQTALAPFGRSLDIEEVAQQYSLKLLAKEDTPKQSTPAPPPETPAPPQEKPPEPPKPEEPKPPKPEEPKPPKPEEPKPPEPPKAATVEATRIVEIVRKPEPTDMEKAEHASRMTAALIADVREMRALGLTFTQEQVDATAARYGVPSPKIESDE